MPCAKRAAQAHLAPSGQKKSSAHRGDDCKKIEIAPECIAVPPRAHQDEKAIAPLAQIRRTGGQKNLRRRPYLKQGESSSRIKCRLPSVSESTVISTATSWGQRTVTASRDFVIGGMSSTTRTGAK